MPSRGLQQANTGLLRRNEATAPQRPKPLSVSMQFGLVWFYDVMQIISRALGYVPGAALVQVPVGQSFYIR